MVEQKRKQGGELRRKRQNRKKEEKETESKEHEGQHINSHSDIIMTAATNEAIEAQKAWEICIDSHCMKS